MNQIDRLSTTLLKNVKRITLLIDSAVVPISFEQFANPASKFTYDEYLKSHTKDWIRDAAIDSECASRLPVKERHRCMYMHHLRTWKTTRGRNDNPTRRKPTEERLRLLESSSKIDFFIIQSQYDLETMSRFGFGQANGQAIENFPDVLSFAQAVLNFLTLFGESVRFELNHWYPLCSMGLQQRQQQPSYDNDDANLQNVALVSLACGTHGLILPTKLHDVKSTTIDLGIHGKLKLKRDGQNWKSIRLNSGKSDLSLRDVLWSFIIKGPGVKSIVYRDTCRTFLCNPTCPERLYGFIIPSQTSTEICELGTAIIYIALLFSFFLIVFFVLAWCALINKKTRIVYAAAATLQEDDKLLQTLVQKLTRVSTTTATLNAKSRPFAMEVLHLFYWPCSARGLAETPRPRPILKDVSVRFAFGRVHGIIGETGGGKTVLIELIACKRSYGSLVGRRFINGIDVSSQFSCNNVVAYVSQSDYFFPALTAREQLTYCELLSRGPSTLNSHESDRVNLVAKLLKLEDCLDTHCGDGGISTSSQNEIQSLGGLSGGERRRLSLACQLVRHRLPSILVLDEPTSGQDATNALLVARVLKELADTAGITVIYSVHQARRSIFDFIDTLTVMVKGQCVLTGKSPMDTFRAFGVSSASIENAGDALLDDLLKSRQGEVDIKTLLRVACDGEEEKNVEWVDDEFEAVAEIDTNYNDGVSDFSSLAASNGISDSHDVSMQSYVMLSRTIRRGGFDIHPTFLVSIVGGVLTSLVFLGASDSYRKRTSWMYLSVAAIVIFQATFLGDRYWADKFVFDSERNSGAPRSWKAFVLSLYSRFVFTSMMESLAFALPVSMALVDGEKIAIHVLIIILAGVASCAQYLLVEIIFMRPDDKRTGALINMFLISISSLFNGFIIRIEDLPFMLSLVPYFTISYWSFAGLVVNGFVGLELPCQDADEAIACAQKTGDVYLKLLGFEKVRLEACLFALLFAMSFFILAGCSAFYFIHVVRKDRSAVRFESNINVDLQNVRKFEPRLLISNVIEKSSNVLVLILFDFCAAAFVCNIGQVGYFLLDVLFLVVYLLHYIYRFSGGSLVDLFLGVLYGVDLVIMVAHAVTFFNVGLFATSRTLRAVRAGVFILLDAGVVSSCPLVHEHSVLSFGRGGLKRAVYGDYASLNANYATRDEAEVLYEEIELQPMENSHT